MKEHHKQQFREIYQHLIAKRAAIEAEKREHKANWVNTIKRLPKRHAIHKPKPALHDDKSKRFTMREVAKRLKVNFATVYWFWTKGSSTRRALPREITSVGNMRRVFIHEADLIAWLQEYRSDLIKVWRSH